MIEVPHHHVFIVVEFLYYDACVNPLTLAGTLDLQVYDNISLFEDWEVLGTEDAIARVGGVATSVLLRDGQLDSW